MSKQVDSHLALSGDVRPRLKWTRQLHECFVDAVVQLGGADKATPKSVMRKMRVPGLTLYHLKSHLQKYRLAKNREPSSYSDIKKQGTAEIENKISNEISPQSHFNEAILQVQMEVQKKLHEQIEVQRHLQLRIEAQGKYLQSVLRKAQETLAEYSSNCIGTETVMAELSELASAVGSERMSTSFRAGGVPDDQAETADCSTDSCLTSKEGKPYRPSEGCDEI